MTYYIPFGGHAKCLRLMTRGEWGGQKIPKTRLRNTWMFPRHLLDRSCWYGLKFYLGIKLLFFEIESWNFQLLFESKFHETSQNFNSFSLFWQLLFSFFLLVVWLSWNFVRFQEIFFSKRFWNFQLSILKNKNVLSLKKAVSCQYQNEKTLFTDPIFSESFAYALVMSLSQTGSSHSSSWRIFSSARLVTFFTLAWNWKLAKYALKFNIQ